MKLWETLKPIFDNPLNGDRNIDGDEMKKVIDVCASETKSVERLVCTGRFMHGDVFSKFFDANRGSLSSICVDMLVYEAGTKMDEFLESLLELPALEKVWINCEIPTSFSKALHNRGVVWKP